MDHLDFFKFVGRVVGKALFDGQSLDAYFTRSFYKHMLGQRLTYQVRPHCPTLPSHRATGASVCSTSGRHGSAPVPAETGVASPAYLGRTYRQPGSARCIRPAGGLSAELHGPVLELEHLGFRLKGGLRPQALSNAPCRTSRWGTLTSTRPWPGQAPPAVQLLCACTSTISTETPELPYPHRTSRRWTLTPTGTWPGCWTA